MSSSTASMRMLPPLKNAMSSPYTAIEARISDMTQPLEDEVVSFFWNINWLIMLGIVVIWELHFFEYGGVGLCLSNSQCYWWYTQTVILTFIKSLVGKLSTESCLVLTRVPYSKCWCYMVCIQNINSIPLIIKTLLFRYWSDRDLKKEVKYQVEYQRARPVDDRSEILVPHVPGIWGPKDPLFKERIVKAVAGISQAELENFSDTNCMKRFLNNSPRADYLVDPDLVDFQNMIPTHAPLLDILHYDAIRKDSWDFPSAQTLAHWKSLRGVSYEYLDLVEVKEIVIGSSSEAQIAEFSDWVFERIKENEDIMGSGALSFDVEDLKITYYDYIRMSQVSFRSMDIVLAKKLGKYKPIEAPLFECEEFKDKDCYMNLPVKIMFGDGVTWCAMISFDIVETDKGMVMTLHDINKSILDLLEKLPVVYGLGIKGDVVSVEVTLRELSGKEFQMAGFIDLGNLAVLAGWELQYRHMTAMSMIVLGGTMNKVCSIADSLWGISYRKLPDALKVYALADIKFGFMTYHVLMSLLLRQLFPDPDIACRLSDVDQKQYVTWFSSWIRDALQGTVIADKEFARARNRHELMLSIKFRDSAGRLSDFSPERIKFIKRMVYWPTLTAGGPRYLQPVRVKYLEQYEVLRMSQVPNANSMFSKELTTADFLYASFGHENLGSLDITLSVPRSLVPGQLGLVCHPDLYDMVLVMNNNDLVPAAFFREAGRANRDLPQAMLEWMRLDLTNIERLLDACVRSEMMSKFFRSKYEHFRLLYLRCSNREALRVRAIEDVISNDNRRAREECELRLAKARLDLDYCTELQVKLDRLVKCPVYQDRTNWKVWAEAHKPHKFVPRPRTPPRVSATVKYSQGKVVSLSTGGQKRDRSQSVKSRLGNRLPRSRSRTPAPKRGRSQEQKQVVFARSHEEVVRDPSIPLRARSHGREPDEHESGGRVSKAGGRKKKKKGAASTSASKLKPLTQDVIEEEGRDFEPEPEYFSYDF